MLKGFKSIAISLVLGLITSIAFNYSNLFYAKNWWWSLLLFLAMYISLNILNNTKSNPESATDKLLGAIWVKTILLLFAIFLYSLVDKKGLFHFSMHFIAHYILFTVFEIRYLLSKIKNEQIKK